MLAAGAIGHLRMLPEIEGRLHVMQSVMLCFGKADE